MFPRLFILGLVCATSAYASSICACTIPVFRYALDRWEADKFSLILPAAAAQDSALNDLLRPLRANGKANLEITISKDASITTAELHDSRHSDRPVWSGDLNAETLPTLLDSPARQKILEHILAGDSVIWVIAEGGTEADKIEAERIEKRLRFLEQVAALPVQNPNDPDSQLGPGPPLLLKFTTLRLRRDDPTEQPLIHMLAGPQGKVDPSTTSFAAAIFARGRVLGAWPLTDLDDASLEDACMFLVGRCSCRLKNENPGWDILMNVDWEKTLAAVKPDPIAEPTIEKVSLQAPVTVTTEGTQAKMTLLFIPMPWPVFAGFGAVVLGGLALILLRNK